MGKSHRELQSESSTPPPLPEKIDYDESKDPIDFDEEKPIKSVEFQKEVELVESDYDYKSDLDITPKPTVSNKIHQLLSSPSFFENFIFDKGNFRSTNQFEKSSSVIFLSTVVFLGNLDLIIFYP